MASQMTREEKKKAKEQQANAGIKLTDESKLFQASNVQSNGSNYDLATKQTTVETVADDGLPEINESTVSQFSEEVCSQPSMSSNTY
jgi:hypothetical protein